jgi:hypothetical protein
VLGTVLVLNGTSVVVAAWLYGTPVFEEFGLLSAVIVPTTSVLFALVAFIIGARATGNRVAWLMLAIGFAYAVAMLCGVAVAWELANPGAVAGATALEWAARVAWYLMIGLFWPQLLLLFPDGRLPSSRWGAVQAIQGAVLRYRPYEIDRIISRTIGWALVTAILVMVFASAVLGLQALMAGVTQGETLAVAASTLGALALFQPVRRRVQSAVDRRFDRAGYDGEHVVAGFGERLRDEVDLDAIRTDMFVTIEKAVRPSSVGSWLRAQPQGRA